MTEAQRGFVNIQKRGEYFSKWVCEEILPPESVQTVHCMYSYPLPEEDGEIDHKNRNKKLCLCCTKPF